MKSTLLLIPATVIFTCISLFISAQSTHIPDDNFEQGLLTKSTEIENTSYREQIPIEEYKTLEELYYSTVGDSWTNNTNWLDTVNISVADWYGITVRNGHVTKIELSNNNLNEYVFENTVYLSELEILDLSNNLIDGANFNSLDSLAKLTKLNIANNKFLTQHIVALLNLPYYKNFADNLEYAPQARFGSKQEVTFEKGGLLEMTVAPFYISDNDQFQWYKDGVVLSGENYSSYYKNNASRIDLGVYTLKITNPNVRELVIESQDIVVSSDDFGAGIPKTEYQALEALYNKNNGENWIWQTNWLDTIDHCVGDWIGVTVEDGHVVELLRDSVGITGALPIQLSQLKELRWLYMGANNITEIPTWINQFTKLEVLELYSSNLSGEIPSSIGELSQLSQLNLCNNNLSGSIPVEMGNLKNILSIWMENNQLSGTIPSSFGNLTNLQNLGLAKNNLNGPLPSELESLSELRTFRISDNLIGASVYNIKSSNSITSESNRQIPDLLANLIQIDTFKIGNNSLQFNDIEPIFSWENFDRFKSFVYWPQNKIGTAKTIETNIGKRVILTIDNYFPGNSDRYQWLKNEEVIKETQIPELTIESASEDDAGLYKCIIVNSVAIELELLSENITLIVNTGVPQEEYKALEAFYNATNGTYWNMNTNWLDTINSKVSEWAGVLVRDGHVRELQLDSNNLVGAIPEQFYDLAYLEQIALAHNSQLSGSLSDNIGNLQQLKVLSLSGTAISGEIPRELATLKKLTHLFLAYNQLSGVLPETISECDNLKFIQLRNNRLNGAIPANLGDLTELEIIDIANNNLDGIIPASLGELSQLRILDLSNNQLVGPVPSTLSNLEGITRFDISGNLFGSTSGTKSALTVYENNRQLPDELGKLLTMDTLILGGNSLQFNDIEAIFSWPNLNDMNVFVYTPQNKIGSSRIIEANQSDSISLTIDNYYPGESDTYQWYKNGELISEAINKDLHLNDLKLENAGSYYCKISNAKATSLILTSREITLSVNEKEPVPQIQKQEYVALEELVNNYPNVDFGENWLDTTNVNVSDWQGVTVRNGHVVALDLSNLNIDGDVFNIFSAFDSLEWVNLSGNNLNGTFPTFDGEKSGSDIKSVKENAYNLKYLNIANNRFMFSDLEPVADELLTIDTFIYSPQQLLGHDIDTSVYKNVSLTIKIDDYRSGEYDIQNWYRNDTYNFVDQEEFIINSVELADSGSYHLQVTNSRFEDLVLQSAPWNLAVMSPVGIKDLKLSDFEVYPNPAKTSLFIDTKNTNVKIELYNTSGNKVLAFEQFTGGWINIAKYPKGLYLLKLDTENSSYSEKVLFK